MQKSSTPSPNRLIIRGDDVGTPGVTYETRRLSVHARTKEAIVIKVPGRTCWSGNYSPREYQPPMLMVFLILESTKKGEVEHLSVKPVIEWDCGRKRE